MRFVLYICVTSIVMLTNAQVQWAHSVAYTNDVFTVPEYPGQFEPKQALGVPDVYPTAKKANGFSYLMGYGTQEKDIQLKVEFKNPMIAKQIIIVEPWGAGAITKITVESDQGQTNIVYQDKPFKNKDQSRIWHLPIKFKQKIKYITIFGEPSKDGEWNCIDAIGISADNKPITCEINLSKSNLFVGEKIALPNHINSPYQEVMPVITPDGKTLYFCRKDHPQNFLDKGEPKDDIWYSELQQNGTWGPSIHAGKPLNSKGYNFINSISPDGHTLILGNQYGSDGEITGPGVSTSQKDYKGKWSMPQNLKIPGFKNTNPFFSFFMSNSQDILLMAVENENSIGEKDIFVSFLLSNGKWSVPENLGASVNTPFSEDTPVLASDNKTLYFSSRGYYGHGEADIYVTKRLDDTWEKWSPPLNLGPKINTNGGDLGFTISAEGKNIYLYSYGNETKSSDLYMINIQKDEQIKPDPVILVSGKVYDAKTKRPIQAEIRYENLEDGKNAGYAQSNSETGSYKIVLPSGSHYGFYAITKGYMAVHQNLETKETKEYGELVVDLYLVPIERGQSVTLNNVFFERSKATLLSTSYPELDKVAKMLVDNPKMEIRLDGHTDNVGSEDLLLQLSLDRVSSVKTYLVSKGISARRISTKAFGSSKPVASNNKEETRKLNRRVEFTVVDF